MKKLIAVASATMMLAACNPAPQGEYDDERPEQSEDREDEDD
jgi:protein involved in sex pheromone biosynthesis